MKAAPVTSETREMTRAAAQWLALLDCDEFSEADLARLQNWRNSHPGHERAWQRALLLRQRFSGLPPELAMASLDRPDLGRRRALKQALGVAVVLPAAWLLGRQLPAGKSAEAGAWRNSAQGPRQFSAELTPALWSRSGQTKRGLCASG